MREDNVRKIWSDAELDAALSDLHGDVDEDDGLAFARASLMAAAGTSEAPKAAPRRGTWRWIAVAAAVVTLVGGLAVVTSLRSPAPEPARPAATLADLDRPLQPGEFHYAQKLQWLPENLEGQSAEMQQSVELWIPADPTGVWHRRTKWTGAVRELKGSPNVRVNLAPFDEDAPAGRFQESPKLDGQTKPNWNTPFQKWLTPDAAFLASIVPDRGKLLKRLAFDTISFTDNGKMHAPTESLTMVRSVLETGLLRREVRVALRDTLGQLNGLFSTPGQTPDGRPATVVIAKDSDQRLFFDPATAQLLAWSTNPRVPMTTTRNNAVPLSSSRTPPPSSGNPPPPVSTTTTPPRSPELPNPPETVYSFAITRTRG